MLKLSCEQIAALTDLPMEGRPNRLAFAFEMARVRQTDVAAVTGLTQSYISAVVNGRYKTITVENARKFAEFFGAPIEVLFPSNTQEAA